MITLYQQRDFGEKINATFTYAVQQFRSLVTALLYIAGPVTLIAGIASGVYQSNMLKSITRVGSGNQVVTNYFGGVKFGLEQIFSPAYWLLILFTLLSYVMVSLTVYSHLKLYARSQGAPITVGEVWQEVQSRLIRGVGLTLVTGLSIFAGLILLILPGLYIAVPLSLAMAVFVFEELSISAIFSRCFKLITDKWWSTFGLSVVMTIITYTIAIVFSLPAGIVAIMGITGGSVSSLVVIITQTVSIIGTQLVSGLVPLALGFQYFNLVERQEGTGLLSAINNIGTMPPIPRVQDEGTY